MSYTLLLILICQGNYPKALKTGQLREKHFSLIIKLSETTKDCPTEYFVFIALFLSLLVVNISLYGE